MTEQQPPPAGEPGQTPPLQPGEGRGGFMGLGEPYVDFIPTFPMVKDPATGEWRNAQPGELPKPEQQPPVDDFDFGTPGPDIEVPGGPVDTVEMTIPQRGVPPGEIPKPEPLPTIAPDTASDDPGGTEQQHTLDNRLDPNAPYDPTNPETLEYRDPYAVTTSGENNSNDPNLPGATTSYDPSGQSLDPDADTPDIPEIGMIPTGMIGPDFGPWPPVGEDTPPPGEPGETPPQPDELIELRNVPPGGIPKPEKLAEEGRDVPPGGIPEPEPLPSGDDFDFGDPGPSIEVPGEVIEDGTVEEKIGEPLDDRFYGDVDPTPYKFAAGADIDSPVGPEQQQPEGDDQNLNPNLLDPLAPGPTLDTGLVERIEQSPELVDMVNQDPAVAEALERDPTQLDQIEQYLGVAEQRPVEPSGVAEPTGDADPSFMDPSFTEQPPPEQDLGDTLTP